MKPVPTALDRALFVRSGRAFTLLEVVLVAGLLVIISAMILPNFVAQIRGEELPSSARQFRSLLCLVQANAAFDGKRYRLRFPGEDEKDLLGGDQQPIVEREDDPIEEPDVFNPVTDQWAVGKTLVGEVRCSEVRLGKPTIEFLQDRRDNAAEDVADALADRAEEKQEEWEFDPHRPPLEFEPDGACQWATFALTEAPPEVELVEVEEYPTIEVILEGHTGFCWLQRPFYEEELDLFEEKGWPAVLRQDFLRPDELTEDDVLELREIEVRP